MSLIVTNSLLLPQSYHVLPTGKEIYRITQCLNKLCIFWNYQSFTFVVDQSLLTIYPLKSPFFFPKCIRRDHVVHRRTLKNAHSYDGLCFGFIMKMVADCYLKSHKSYYMLFDIIPTIPFILPYIWVRTLIH